MEFDFALIKPVNRIHSVFKESTSSKSLERICVGDMVIIISLSYLGSMAMTQWLIPKTSSSIQKVQLPSYQAFQINMAHMTESL